jgi:hypothetical protein
MAEEESSQAARMSLKTRHLFWLDSDTIEPSKQSKKSKSVVPSENSIQQARAVGKASTKQEGD